MIVVNNVIWDHITFFRPSVWSIPDIQRLWRGFIGDWAYFQPNFTPFYPLFCPSISLKWLYFDWYCCNCLPHKIPLNYMTYPSKILFSRIFNCKFSHFYPFLPNFTPVSVPVRPQKMFILANNKIWLCRILSCIYVIFTLILTYLREF